MCPIGIDANALDRDGSDRDAAVDRLLNLCQTGKINLMMPHGVRNETQDPRTPATVREVTRATLFAIPTNLTHQELTVRRQIESALQGNARPGKHAADAQHLAEAAKYCGYFITHDKRILKKSDGFHSLLPPSLSVVTLAVFLEIFDDYEAGRRI